ncbi:6,7-dimethyl-8-ribityllumazine synthase [Egicoccus halophilus]|uniref:6,7-dimethyl-8-ribityllumazine synthase n=1 Tax=Egicoccus halophilus TaxID=1670830 RepID=A0A8J3A986_9ACTN|nr:6,7-dimethyl-8-ribityllumazine synthase [Egicoccus halophilus]GGI07464.1 6,7-dimethyl-8-ribityllumazine synthase [Egicoccus halophilus]
MTPNPSNDVRVVEGGPDAGGLRIGIVAARFNEAIVERLVDGALGALRRHGASPSALTVAWVPGAFELPVVLRRLATGGEVDALVALGCVVRGSTPHFDYVAGEAASGVGAVARETGVPIAFGVLTTDTWEQAVERAGGKLGNKGAEAALSVVETARVLRQL